MKYIAISFTIKGQKMSDIRPVLEKLSERYAAKDGNTVLIHGFMPRATVVEKGFSTELVDTLDELFPVQVGCYHNGKPNRDAMVAIVTDSEADVYAIGSIVDGVAEEVELYKASSVHVSELPLNWTGDMIGRPLTYGEQAVGLTFNPGGSENVNAIKRACANVIDELDRQRKTAKAENNGEKIAMFTLAIRDIQSGQMWGVKAATWQY
jgi:hypothetical protein